jgi:hypothetical protein
MNLQLLEKELKKRLTIPYVWHRKQNNVFDKQTNFIYKINTFEEVLKRIENDFKTHSNYSDLKNYALNRWFNFWSANAVEQFFCEHKDVSAHKNSKDKYTDFYIQNIPFDHKTTIFPKGFNKSVPYAFQYKRELIAWLYKNQSQQQRKHLKNRIFIVLVNYQEENQHWKLKAELLWLKEIISEYLNSFNEDNLECFYFQDKVVKSDIIWAVK